MTPMDLARECKRVIEDEHMTRVLLVVPGWPRRFSRGIRLARGQRRSPLGEVASTLDEPKRTAAYFDAIEVLAWLAGNGLVEVRTAQAAGDGGGG